MFALPARTEYLKDTPKDRVNFRSTSAHEAAPLKADSFKRSSASVLVDLLNSGDSEVRRLFISTISDRGPSSFRLLKTCCCYAEFLTPFATHQVIELLVNAPTPSYRRSFAVYALTAKSQSLDQTFVEGLFDILQAEVGLLGKRSWNKIIKRAQMYPTSSPSLVSQLASTELRELPPDPAGIACVRLCQGAPEWLLPGHALLETAQSFSERFPHAFNPWLEPLATRNMGGFVRWESAVEGRWHHLDVIEALLNATFKSTSTAVLAITGGVSLISLLGGPQIFPPRPLVWIVSSTALWAVGYASDIRKEWATLAKKYTVNNNVRDQLLRIRSRLNCQ
jgi:hypothetical protein